MDADLLEPQRIRRTLSQMRTRTRLNACSICLRVRRGSAWVEPERVIRELRSYELEAPPRLRPALCAVCAETIIGRRVQESEHAAA